jgi:hypothetical protein
MRRLLAVAAFLLLPAVTKAQMLFGWGQSFRTPFSDVYLQALTLGGLRMTTPNATFQILDMYSDLTLRGPVFEVSLGSLTNAPINVTLNILLVATLLYAQPALGFPNGLPSTTTPEPSTIVLMATGLLLIVLVGRHRSANPLANEAAFNAEQAASIAS